MKKLFLSTCCAALVVTGAASASPLTDYSAGKVAIDINYSNQSVDLNNPGLDPLSFNKKSNWDFAGTFGVGNKFAFQYIHANTDSNPISYVSGSDTYLHSYKLNTKQLNVLYQLDKNLSVYTGIARVDGTDTDAGVNFPSNTKNIWQIGLVGTTKAADKLTGFAGVGVGKDLMTYTIGLGYEIAPQLEFNVIYDYKKVRGLRDSVTDDYSITAKGMKYGLTYKF